MPRAKPVLRWLAGGLAIIAALILALLLVFPIELLRPLIASRLSERFDAPVTIGHVGRVGGSLLAPELAIETVAIPQPGWAGGGKLMTLRRASFRLPLLPALVGRLQPEHVRLDGLRLALVRTVDNRSNWQRNKHSGSALPIAGLTLTDAQVSYRDDVWQRSSTLRLTADETHGLDARGDGQVRGVPVRIAAHGPPVTADGGRWPFTAQVDGTTLKLRARGLMDTPLDSRHMDVDLEARADNLKTLDAVIEAGLFDTQPIALRGHARHDWPEWRATGIVGTIGHSHVSGSITVNHKDGRTQIDGDLTADPFDFSDLNTTDRIRAADALIRAGRRRLIPNTPIDLTKLERTDGTLRFAATGVVGNSSPPLRSVSAVLKLDHGLLTVAPIHAGLTRGSAQGTLVADQRGRDTPRVTIDATLSDSDLSALGGGNAVDGRAWGRAHLVGTGGTIRESVGQADGTVWLAARDGSLPARAASLLGLDVGRALTTPGDRRADLRCAILRLDVRRGQGNVRRLLVDTTRSQTNGSGTIDLRDESLALTLSGAPKAHSLLALPGTILVGGMIANPHAALAHGDRSAGSILKAVGRAITGKQPIAQDADCAALTS